MTKTEYAQYLESGHWYYLRRARLEMVGYRCEQCGSEEHLQVHHINYRNIWDVSPDDLQALCRVCHEEAHRLRPVKKDRDRIRMIERLESFMDITFKPDTTEPVRLFARYCFLSGMAESVPLMDADGFESIDNTNILLDRLNTEIDANYGSLANLISAIERPPRSVVQTCT